MGGADAVAVGDGGEALHVRAEDPGERLGLGLAQLRKGGRHMSHRAVVLAQLRAAAGQLVHRRGVPVRGQRGGECLSWVARVADRSQSSLHTCGLATGELADEGVTAGLREEAQGADGEGVVRGLERVASGVGQREDFCWPAAPAGHTRSRLASGDRAVGQEPVEVAAHRSGRERETLAQHRSGLRPVLEQRSGNLRPGAQSVAGAGGQVTRTRNRSAGRSEDGFHYVIVTLFCGALNAGDPKRRAPRPSTRATYTREVRAGGLDGAPHTPHTPHTDPPALVAQGLAKTYGRTVAARNVDLRAERAQITALLGPNGAGKSTTLQCCIGTRRPDAGTVRVLDLDPWTQSAQLRARIGVMPQTGGVYPSARPREIARHVARLYQHPHDPDAMLERVGLEPATRTTYRRLSGGEQQRLSLALALMGRPELVFLDEPTAGLDPHGRRLTWELIEELRRAGVTVVLTTHHLDEAERLADQVVIIDRGEVVASGPTRELLARSSSSAVRFNAPAHLDLDPLRAALPSRLDTAEVAPGAYRVAGPQIDAHVLATLTAWCAGQGVMPDGLRVDQRSLEDVFLELTGRGPHERS